VLPSTSGRPACVCREGAALGAVGCVQGGGGGGGTEEGSGLSGAGGEADAAGCLPRTQARMLPLRLKARSPCGSRWSAAYLLLR
jgi:hypothetical protein